MSDDQGNAADTRRGDYAVAIALDRHDVGLQDASAGKKGVYLVRITPEVISVLDYRKGLGCPLWSKFDRTPQG